MRLQLKERKPEAPEVESFIFEPQERLQWKPGQFFHYVLHHEPTDNRGSDRWFTVSSAPSEQHVMLTTRMTFDKGSSFKKALRELKIGDTVEISDIDGDFIIEDTSAQFVFIAGGIGVTPFRSILKEHAAQGIDLDVTLLYANRDEHIPYKEEFETMAAANPKLKIHYILSPERLDETSIKKYVSDLSKPVFYVSGPEPMVEAMFKMLRELGVPETHLKGDWFPGYPLE